MQTTRRALAAALAALLLLPSAGAPGAAKIRVVTTIPDLADIVRRIGGDDVEVQSIAKGRENVHAVPIRPSHMVAISRADVFVQVGLALEHAWVPNLLQAGRNRRVQPGGEGFVNASEGFEAMQVPEISTRQGAADVHPYGNPHINLDPGAGRHMAEQIEAALAVAAPDKADAFARRAEAYRAELSVAEERWARMAEGLAGKKVVVYHREFDYLLRATGVEMVATVEPRPGVPPTPGHLTNLAKSMKAQGVDLILTAPWSNGGKVESLGRKAGARVVEIPTMVGGAKGADSWIELVDQCHRKLREAFELPPLDE